MNENKNLKNVHINESDHQAVLDAIEVLKEFLKPFEK